MKLSEVIKAIEDGSKSEFKNGQYKFFKCFDIRELYVKTNILIAEIGTFPLDGWEEVKPPRQWSEKELMLFKLLPDWAKWIAKDKDADICIYENEPVKSSKMFSVNQKDEYDYKILELFDFITITFEESPIYIGDLKGE